jgi:hypothetical protein
VLVALDRVGLDAGPDVGEGLLRPTAVGRRERPGLALGVVAGLGERHAVHAPGGLVGAEKVADLLLERDAEGILRDRSRERAMGRRSIVEHDPVAQRGRGRPGDPDGVGGDAIRLGGGEDRGAGEAPAAIDKDPDSETLALPGRDAFDAATLDGDRLLTTVDGADVGIAGAELKGSVEGSLTQVAHGGGE